MADTAPLARSPIPPPPPVTVAGGWEVSARRSDADLRLRDCTPLAKVLVRAPAGGALAAALGAGHGAAARDGEGVLVAGTGPGEWLLLAAPGTAVEVAARPRAAAGDEGLVTVLDVTHGRALVRLRGADSAAVLAKLCALDLEAVPDGSALRTLVAGVAVEVVRDDEAGHRSYLLACDREAGRYLFETLLDAGAEYGIDVEGLAPTPPHGR